MHNSASINLNLLEEIRKFNETFDGVEKENNECNRPKLDQPTKIFYSSSACMYPEHNQLDPLNPDCREESAYPKLLQTQNMDGRSYSVKEFTWRLLGTVVSLFVSLGITIYLVQKAPGEVDGKKHPCPLP